MCENLSLKYFCMLVKYVVWAVLELNVARQKLVDIQMSWINIIIFNL